MAPRVTLRRIVEHARLSEAPCMATRARSGRRHHQPHIAHPAWQCGAGVATAAGNCVHWCKHRRRRTAYDERAVRPLSRHCPRFTRRVAQSHFAAAGHPADARRGRTRSSRSVRATPPHAAQSARSSCGDRQLIRYAAEPLHPPTTLDARPSTLNGSAVSREPPGGCTRRARRYPPTAVMFSLTCASRSAFCTMRVTVTASTIAAVTPIHSIHDGILPAPGVCAPACPTAA